MNQKFVQIRKPGNLNSSQTASVKYILYLFPCVKYKIQIVTGCHIWQIERTFSHSDYLYTRYSTGGIAWAVTTQNWNVIMLII